MVEALKTQNSELRTMLIKATSHKENGHTDSEEEKKRDDVVNTLLTYTYIAVLSNENL